MPSKQTTKYASVASSSSATTTTTPYNAMIDHNKPSNGSKHHQSGITTAAAASMSFSSAYHNHFKNQQSLDNYSRTIMSPHTFHMESSLASSHKSAKTNKSQPPSFAYLNNELSSCHSKFDSNHHLHHPNNYSANQMMIMNGRANFNDTSSKYNNVLTIGK